MFGKGALIIIFGFMLAFAHYQLNLSRSITDSLDNYNEQFVTTLVHEATVSGINMGINKVWDEEINSAAFSFVINSCSVDVVVSPRGTDSIQVKASAAGGIYDAELGTSRMVRDSVVALFSYLTPISRYYSFTNNDRGLFWITGDTVWGRVHTNTVMHTWGSPVFFGKVTARQGINPNPSKKQNEAIYHDGWEIGVDAEVPTDLKYLKEAAIADNGGAPKNTKCYYDKKTSFEFLADGRVIRTVDKSPPDTVRISDIAPGGVIYCKDDIRIKGVLSGQLTLYSEDNIWIDDDIVYATDPLIDPTATDLLGLASGKDIIITDNAPNSSDVVIHASMVTPKGSIEVERYQKRGKCGTMTVVGSMAQKLAGITGVFNRNSGLMSGFNLKGRFDERLSYTSPPRYPAVRELSLVAWWE